MLVKKKFLLSPRFTVLFSVFFSFFFLVSLLGCGSDDPSKIGGSGGNAPIPNVDVTCSGAAEGDPCHGLETLNRVSWAVWTGSPCTKLTFENDDYVAFSIEDVDLEGGNLVASHTSWQENTEEELSITVLEQKSYNVCSYILDTTSDILLEAIGQDQNVTLTIDGIPGRNIINFTKTIGD
jgi:hypothetical protein